MSTCSAASRSIRVRQFIKHPPSWKVRLAFATRYAGPVAVFQFSQFSCLLAPSSVPVSESNDYAPHAMTEEEIDAYINIYADAAAVAKAAGADGVEIHCAHD